MFLNSGGARNDIISMKFEKRWWRDSNVVFGPKGMVIFMSDFFDNCFDLLESGTASKPPASPRYCKGNAKEFQKPGFSPITHFFDGETGFFNDSRFSIDNVSFSLRN